ncbi:unnamed protein product [Psylliodes chrysocephalus]|uniref:Uncharacterized protein n=1 Tax=Psylliodes chrysocephalus TaxID=3402493 RepID=A0A9P0CXK3_9CUCU|nr:unnamed protein product [Psylliodes chrysocephala]
MSNNFNEVEKSNSFYERPTLVGSTKSKSMHVSSASKKTRKAKLLAIQEEIDEIQDSIFLKQEEIFNLECEVAELKGKEIISQKDVEAKEGEINRKKKLLNLLESKLENKKTFFSKYEEYFNINSDSNESEDSRRDLRSLSIEKSTRLRNTEEWVSKNHQCLDYSLVSHNNDVENLTKSINSMLTRQTVGKQLINFDGSSHLKWPIYYSQFLLTDKACLFSPEENVLRLNDSLSGEARKSVEMLLITARNPDKILNILKQKYGRLEAIMEELLSKAHQISSVESAESFIDFNSTVQNLAAAINEDLANYIDERHLLAILVNKLPPHLLTQWGSYLIDHKVEDHKESLQDFSNWVQQMSKMISRISFVSKNTNPTFHLHDSTNGIKLEENLLKNNVVPVTKKICCECKRTLEDSTKMQCMLPLFTSTLWKM